MDNSKILIIGTASDNLVNYFENYLLEYKHEYIFLNQDHLGINIHLNNSYIFFKNKSSYKLDEFSGILNRMAAANPSDNNYFLQQRFCSYLQACLDVKCKNIINPLVSGKINESKPYQLKFLKSSFIKLPSTYIFANTDLNVDMSNNTFIFKSVSAFRSEVRKLNEKYIKNKVTCPLLVQNMIEGSNIRVHVINEKVFSLKIDSSVVDYRYNQDITVEKIDLPKCISDECISIAKQLNLKFTGIDLILDKFNNEYYILEANPSPGYSYFEKYFETKPISAALVKALQI